VILPLMAANITGYAVARRLSPTPIYDALIPSGKCGPRRR